MPKGLILAAALTAAFPFPATTEAKDGNVKRAEIVETQEVTMADGTKATFYVVRLKHKGVWTHFTALHSHVAPIAKTRKLVSDANTVVVASSSRANTMIAEPEDKTPDCLHQKRFTVAH